VGNLKDSLQVKMFLFKAFMEVQEYYVCAIQPDYILVKKIDDLYLTKVYDFELESGIWFLDPKKAKESIADINRQFGVTIDSIPYRRGFKLTNKQVRDTDEVFESCFGGSQFISETVHQFTVVKLTLLDIFEHQGQDVVKLTAVERCENTVPTEPFHITLSGLLGALNMFTTEQALFADMQRTAMAELFHIRKLYDVDCPLYKQLTDEQREVIKAFIKTRMESADNISKSYEAFLTRMKTETRVANAEKDAHDILRMINK
jgi:hypothetical protein